MAQEFQRFLAVVVIPPDGTMLIEPSISSTAIPTSLISDTPCSRKAANRDSLSMPYLRMCANITSPCNTSRVGVPSTK